MLDHDDLRGALSQIPNIWDEQRTWDHGMHGRRRGNMHATWEKDGLGSWRLTSRCATGNGLPSLQVYFILFML
jgi:hypothetical protein